MSLGLTLKSMTGSKTVTNLINRFGHCVSNEKVRRIDIGLESTINQSNSFVPDNIKNIANSCIGLAWDNFDINLETLSGENSIYHTYGICYQNITLNDSNSTDQQTSTGRKRKLKEITKGISPEQHENLQPDRKIPKMTVFDFNTCVIPPPDLYSKYVELDILWVMSFNNCSMISMWTGWNTKRYMENLPHQRIAYMKPITLPPTRTDVVRETLRRSKVVSDECGATYTIVS